MNTSVMSYSFLNPNWKISLFYTGVIGLDKHIKFHLLSCSFAVHLQNSENMLMCDFSKRQAQKTHTDLLVHVFIIISVHYCVQIAVRKNSRLVWICLVLPQCP